MGSWLLAVVALEMDVEELIQHDMFALLIIDGKVPYLFTLEWS